MIISIIIAIISIIGLLTLHEFGHFIIAKKIGLKVEEFGIGYPPKLLGKKYGETLYSLNLLPFGAFVKIPELEGEKFSFKPAWQRASVLFGGVVSFWIIAAILLSIVFGMGATQAISDTEQGPLVNPKVQILAVAPNSPIEKAGIKAGDAIIKIQNPKSKIQIDVNKVKEVQEFTDKNKGEEIVLTIQRGKEIFEASLVPRVSPPEGEGAMGVALARTAEKSYSWFQAPIKGIEATLNLTYAVVVGWVDILGGLVQSKGLPKGVQFMGPIGIGALVTQAAQVGINYFLQFIAMIAVYLAVFNVLPIPALDGGKLLFLGIEKIKGSPVNRKIEENVTSVFFVLLILLMVFVTIKDITRLF